jgi:hypothetical protein
MLVFLTGDGGNHLHKEGSPNLTSLKAHRYKTGNRLGDLADYWVTPGAKGLLLLGVL